MNYVETYDNGEVVEKLTIDGWYSLRKGQWEFDRQPDQDDLHLMRDIDERVNKPDLQTQIDDLKQLVQAVADTPTMTSELTVEAIQLKERI